MAEPPRLLKGVPDEILVQVCSHLRKSELKVLRQVCKYLCNLVNPFLFDRIVFSSSWLDREAFDGVVHHPILSLFVRELVCDIQVFHGYSKDENHNGNRPRYLSGLGRGSLYKYCDLLISQLKSQSYEPMRRNCRLFEGDARSILEYASSNDHSVIPQGRFMMRELDNQLINKGMKAYFLEHVQRQYDLHQPGNQWLRKKVDKLQNIRTIKLQTSWDLDYGDDPFNPRYSSNGAFARSWHPLYLQPNVNRYNGGPSISELGVPKLLEVFWDHYHSVRRIEFDHGSRIPPDYILFPWEAFNDYDKSWNTKSSRKLQHGRRTFAHLHHLTLDLDLKYTLSDPNFPGDVPDHEISLQGLKESLQRASCLRSLDFGIYWRDFPQSRIHHRSPP
ncbi:MAG: hypothetical protein Q9167_002652 [Letrouitia subvulpina]